MLHGSQELGGKGLERPNMKHEKSLGVSHGSQEQSIKMKHENGGGYFS